MKDNSSWATLSGLIFPVLGCGLVLFGFLLLEDAAFSETCLFTPWMLQVEFNQRMADEMKHEMNQNLRKAQSEAEREQLNRESWERFADRQREFAAELRRYRIQQALLAIPPLLLGLWVGWLGIKRWRRGDADAK